MLACKSVSQKCCHTQRNIGQVNFSPLISTNWAYDIISPCQLCMPLYNHACAMDNPSLGVVDLFYYQNGSMFSDLSFSAPFSKKLKPFASNYLNLIRVLSHYRSVCGSLGSIFLKHMLPTHFCSVHDVLEMK